MEKQNLFRKSVLAGVLTCSLGLMGCVADNNEETVVFAEAVYTSPVEGGCDTGSADCLMTDPEGVYLTESFVETYEVAIPTDGVAKKAEADVKAVKSAAGDTVLATSRPASVKAVSVKEKKAAAQTQVFADGVAVKTADAPKAEAVKAEEKPVEAVKAEVVADEKVVAVAPAANKTVRTTITEKTTLVKEDPAKKAAEEKKPETLAEKIAYGESVHDWEAVAGDTLRSLLQKWGDVSGWTVVWKLDRDYHLEAGVVFRGNFVDASGALVRSFARATPAPIGTFYKGNRVLVISTQEDENER